MYCKFLYLGRVTLFYLEIFDQFLPKPHSVRSLMHQAGLYNECFLVQDLDAIEENLRAELESAQADISQSAHSDNLLINSKILVEEASEPTLLDKLENKKRELVCCILCFTFPFSFFFGPLHYLTIHLLICFFQSFFPFILSVFSGIDGSRSRGKMGEGSG